MQFSQSNPHSGATRKLGVVALAAMLAACGTTGTTSQAPLPAPPVSVAAVPTGPGSMMTKDGLTPPFMADRAIVRVGILLPFASRAEDARALYQAAELAVFDFGDRSTLLIPRESGATPAEAKDAARLLVRDGADVILGPVQREAVQGAAEIARAANIPVVAFSSDSQVAGGGVYLLSIPLEEDVRRIAEYAIARGIRSIALLAPEGDYGRRVEQTLTTELAQRGGTLTASQIYKRTDADAAEAARTLAGRLRTTPAQAVLIADNGSVLRSAGSGLLAGGLRIGQGPGQTKLLGTGAWATGEAQREPTLSGGLYPSPDPSLRAEFERRFKLAHGRAPSRIASYGYDAVMVALKVAQAQRGQVNRQGLEQIQGFQGADGVFRFRQNGTIERGLAVLEVRPEGTRVSDSAPRGFGGS